jgi:hypothetical protein
MAFVDDPNKKQQQNTMNTLQPGASDIQQPQPASPGPSQAPSSGSGGAIQSAPSPRQQQKPASSGTFTNLQQYSKANVGGAQRIAQTTTQNVAQQGKQVQQQAQQQAARTQSDIQQNQAKIAAEQAFARQQLERAGTAEDTSQFFTNSSLNEAGLARLGDKAEEFQTRYNEINNRRLPMDVGPGSSNAQASAQQAEDRQALMTEFGLGQVYNPSEEEFKRFRDIVEGQTQFNQVRDLDLTNQMIASQQLQQQAQQAGTDTGRMALLRQMLGQGREYTRGQTALDAALIARDAEARQALQGGLQQTAEQTQQAVQGISGDVSAKRQALQALNARFGSDIMTEGDTATTGVLDDVESGRVSLADARAQLSADLGITEAEAEERMDQMAQERVDLNAARQRNENAGYTYGGALGYAGRGMKLSKEQEEALALAGVDPKLAMTEDEKAYYEANRTGSYRGSRSRPGGSRSTHYFDRSNRYIWDQGSLGYGLDANINRMLGGEASALRAGVGSEALARQLEMSGGNIEGLQGGANELYANLRAGKDISTQTAASIEQARRYNALQDLLKGKGGVGASGKRTLSLDQAGKAAEQEALLRQARAEAMRKFKIQGE